MNREFLHLYNRELKVLYEQASEFAEEYPGVAERLGGLINDRPDPMIGGLLQGAAFLAARVQLKLKHEFPEFTNNLLEQLLPHFLAPTPSALLAQVVPAFGDPVLRDGSRIGRDTYIDATYRERERRIACRYRLCSDITLWPFDVIGAEYYATPGPLQALGLPVGADVAAALRLTLTHRTASRLEDEVSDSAARKMPDTWFAGCRTKDLTVHLLGGEAEAIALYEQLFADCVGVYFRFLDAYGDPVVMRAPEQCLSQIGFDPAEALLPRDKRVFEGFDLLREYFLFPRKFLGFRLDRLGEVMPRLAAKSVDVIFTFDEANTRLAAAVSPGMFALHAAPGINLFEMTCDRVSVRTNEHEHHVVPDRSHPLDYEPHRVLSVHAHYNGGRDRAEVHPLYSPMHQVAGSDLFYTVRRLPRRRTARERSSQTESDYIGTEMFLSLAEETSAGDASGVAELSVRALCSNRHLPEHLPVGEGGADFRLLDNTTLNIRCVAGPTAPREPVVKQLRSRTDDVQHTGAVTWRLLNMLSVNHLGLIERGAGRSGHALREILSLFADLSDSVTERRIRGLRSIDSRPVVRRVRHRSGIGAARGLEVTVTLDERSFEGSGIFLLGAILDRFFAEYAAVNHFTQTVIRSSERGEIVRWPPRAGARGAL